MVGFYAISASRITFGRDGEWYSDGERITNQRIADLFSRHLQRQPDGSYQIRMADERATVEVEDTPFVVRSVSVDENGATIDLNDRTSERLDPSTLEVGEAEVLYCRVKGGSERARFLRPAYYQLASHFDEADAGRFCLRLPNGVHPLG